MPLKTQSLIVNLGPQHPSTHGVFSAVIELDGERWSTWSRSSATCTVEMEKMAEGRTYLQDIPLTDRLDYVASMSNNWAYCAPSSVSWASSCRSAPSTSA